MNQELLILQFQQKDVKAYEKLYNMYCNSISGVVNTIVKNDNVQIYNWLNDKSETVSQKIVAENFNKFYNYLLSKS